MRRSRAIACIVALLAAGAGVIALRLVGGRDAASRGPADDFTPTVSGVVGPPPAFEPGEPPRLLPGRVVDPARPPAAWERLLAADGSPAEDLAALGDLVAGYLHAGPGETRRAIGFNEDLAPALTDAAALGEAALPADHPAIRAGRLIDRWGTPWQVHPLAADKIELRSAGPDRRLYTADDVTGP